MHEKLRTAMSILAAGTTIAGRYEVVSPLAKGGMGFVYRARQIALDRIVAIKVLPMDDDPTAYQRFELEAKSSAGLIHPNIVSVFDYGRMDDGRPFLVMECIDGAPLFRLLKTQGPFQEKHAASIFSQICDGLYCAHRQGVVHRDLKPGNILLVSTPTGEIVKLIDFGLAKRFLENQNLTQSGVLVGTPLYMSPEQCRGTPTDARSDIYSLGCVLYQMIAGVPPFEGDSAISTMYKHLLEAPVFVKPPISDVSEGMKRIILKCMEKELENRYQSALELKSALHSLYAADGGGSIANVAALNNTAVSSNSEKPISASVASASDKPAVGNEKETGQRAALVAQVLACAQATPEPRSAAAVNNSSSAQPRQGTASLDQADLEALHLRSYPPDAIPEAFNARVMPSGSEVVPLPAVQHPDRLQPGQVPPEQPQFGQALSGQRQAVQQGSPQTSNAVTFLERTTPILDVRESNLQWNDADALSRQREGRGTKSPDRVDEPEAVRDSQGESVEQATPELASSAGSTDVVTGQSSTGALANSSSSSRRSNFRWKWIGVASGVGLVSLMGVCCVLNSRDFQLACLPELKSISKQQAFYLSVKVADGYLDEGDSHKALSMYQYARGLAEEHVEFGAGKVAHVHAMLGQLYQERPQLQQALRSAQRARSILEDYNETASPDYAPSIANIAVIREKQGDRKSAMETYDKAIEIFGRQPLSNSHLISAAQCSQLRSHLAARLQADNAAQTKDALARGKAHMQQHQGNSYTVPASSGIRSASASPATTPDLVHPSFGIGSASPSPAPAPDVVVRQLQSAGIDKRKVVKALGQSKGGSKLLRKIKRVLGNILQ